MIEYALTYMKAISVVAATVLVVARVAMAAWRTVTASACRLLCDGVAAAPQRMREVVRYCSAIRMRL